MRTILVVDDEAPLRQSIRFVLRNEYRIVEAGDGGTALRLAQSESPDVVLLDINLPDMDGREVLRRLREMQPETNVVMVTAANAVRTAVPVGGGHLGVAVNPTTNRIYVANSFSGSISAIEGASNTERTTGPVGLFPCVARAKRAHHRIAVVHSAATPW